MACPLPKITPDSCGTSAPGGLVTIEYLPLAYVDKVASATLSSFTHNWTGAISAATEWYKLYASVNDRGWTDRFVPTEQGGHLERSVTARLIGISPQRIDALEKMKQYRYLVRITDRKRNRYLLGDLQHGADMDYDIGTGTATTTPQGINITFKGLTPYNAYSNNG